MPSRSPQTPDWPLARLLYESAPRVLTVGAIASRCRIPERSVRRRALREGWTLAPRVVGVAGTIRALAAAGETNHAHIARQVGCTRQNVGQVLKPK